MTLSSLNKRLTASMARLMLLVSVPILAQSTSAQGIGKAVITVLSRHEGEVAPSVANQDLAVKVNGKTAQVTQWKSLNAPENAIELVILIDDSARTSLGTQLGEIAAFVKTLPPNTRAGIAYMRNGRAAWAAPLSYNREQIASALRLPGGGAGASASPYFCLSDLAKNWPSHDVQARREVIMIADGLDRYQPGFDPSDPYVHAAISDAVTARLIVYSIYWVGRGRGDDSQAASNAGQNLLQQVTQGTGGRSFGLGFGNPVSFQPYFEELTRRFRNQYELGFQVPGNGKPEVESFKLKLVAPGVEVNAPQQVLVSPVAQN